MECSGLFLIDGNDDNISGYGMGWVSLGGARYGAPYIADKTQQILLIHMARIT